EIPRRGQSGKNSADIRLCVDAMDLAYSKEHIDTFVVVSGDSDFSPLVSKLKELGKHVIGLGMQESTSDLLRDNCDEFIYYEDLGKASPELPPVVIEHLPETKRKAFALLMESLLALRRENKEVLWSSMIKDTMKRKKPSFNEAYHGYRTFSELLEDAQKEGLLELDTDKRSRTYVVTRFGSEVGAEPTGAAAGEVKKRSRRRRAGAKKRDGRGGSRAAPAEEARAGREEPREEAANRHEEERPAEAERPARDREEPADRDAAPSAE
ncbi:MAG TPA: NYN domain-containing protein, partial [Gemmataceae bacterium]|nr:NYN domain-containing protein [Gemmataceae bacterium]